MAEMSIPAIAPSVPSPPYALALSRRLWNLRARAQRGENVADDIARALAERATYRCRDI